MDWDLRRYNTQMTDVLSSMPIAWNYALDSPQSIRITTSYSTHLSESSSLLLPASHGPLTTHNTCVNPMLTRAVPEQPLVGKADPQLVDGKAPKWQVMWRISLGRRPSERRWIRERMSVRRREVIICQYLWRGSQRDFLTNRGQKADIYAFLRFGLHNSQL